MTASISAKSNGTQGALLVNGAEAVTFNANGIIRGVLLPVRQTVLNGPVDANGLPSFGGSTGGTTVTAAGTLTVAAAGGLVDIVGTITNPSWTGLSTNGTMFMYLDVSADGTCIPGVTALAPTYRWGGADVVTNLQNTFNIQEMTMKVGNGATAAQVYRVFVGEVAVAGAVVTAITWYALMGRYVSAVTAISSGTSYNFNHNIGVPAPFLKADALQGPASNNVNYEYIKQQAEAGTVYGSGFNTYTRNSVVHGTSNLARGYTTTGGAGTSAYAQVFVSRGF